MDDIRVVEEFKQRITKIANTMRQRGIGKHKAFEIGINVVRGQIGRSFGTQDLLLILQTFTSVSDDKIADLFFAVLQADGLLIQTPEGNIETTEGKLTIPKDFLMQVIRESN